MKRSRFTEERIVHAVRQVEAGMPAVERCRKLGITEHTCSRWKRKFAGLGAAEPRRSTSVEDENRRLEQPVADPALDKHVRQEALRNNG